MIVGELLKDFDQYNTVCDIVKICTNDPDFGCFVDVELVSIDNLMSEAEYTGLRIKQVKRWWLDSKQYYDEYNNIYGIERCFVIQI